MTPTTEPRRCGTPNCTRPAHPDGWLCTAHGCRRCGHVILADTEDWPEPLCFQCMHAEAKQA